MGAVCGGVYRSFLCTVVFAMGLLCGIPALYAASSPAAPSASTPLALSNSVSPDASQVQDAPPLEVMAGQLLLVGFRGLTAKEAAPVLADITQRHLGGVILFRRDMVGIPTDTRNIRNPGQLRELVGALQGAAAIPLFIAIDQEGGAVSRLRAREGFADFPSARALGEGTPEATRQNALALGRMLRQAGINLNFAPVIDVNVNPKSPAIGAMDRAFSADPAVVGRHGLAFAQGLREAGVIPVFKHFPGYGSAGADPHANVTDVTATWSVQELVPWDMVVHAARQQGNVASMMIMTAHLMQRHLDSRYPASLSYPIITELLREGLGYAGLVVSDDLQMHAISKQYDLETVVVQSLMAGADILLFSNTMVYDDRITAKVVDIIVRNVRKGVIPHERLVASWRRVAACKAALSSMP